MQELDTHCWKDLNEDEDAQDKDLAEQTQEDAQTEPVTRGTKRRSESPQHVEKKHRGPNRGEADEEQKDALDEAESRGTKRRSESPNQGDKKNRTQLKLDESACD